MVKDIDISRINLDEDIDKLISRNKNKIKIITDTNSELVVRKNYQNKNKLLQKEVHNLEKELQNTHQHINNAWEEKIRAEEEITNSLEEQWKKLTAEIAANADTPGYQQAIKHTDLQDGVHKADIPSTRTNYKNTASRLQHEIKKLQQQVNERKLCLINEVKKKNAIEEEVRDLRTNMVQHRRSVTPSRMTGSIPDLVFQPHTHTTANIT